MTIHPIKRLLAAGIVASLFAASAFGQAFAQEGASKNPSVVKAGSYTIEPIHTQVVFTISHFGFSNFRGFFTGASGSLEIDPAKVNSAKVEVTIPIASVLTTSTALDGILKGDQWFDAQKFPTATFTSTKVTSTGKDTASIAGNLTLHGVTKPVTLKARLVGSGVNPLDKSFTVGFDGTVTIKRSDFGIDQYVQAFSDEVALQIAAAFVLKQ